MLAGEARRALVRLLEDAGQQEAARKSKLLLAHLLGCRPADLPLCAGQPLTTTQWARLERQAQSLIAGEPLQYLLGAWEFMGLSLLVKPGVLIPRPDTEISAAAAIELLQEHAAPRVADLGTGTGALALSIAHYLPRAEVYGVDISETALALARENAARLGLTARCRFLFGDWGAPLAAAGLRFDLIVSNPPYVTDLEMANLPPEVQREPALALAGGADGLDSYRRLARELPPLLEPHGRLVLEHGWRQQDALAALLTEAGWRIDRRLADYAGRPRALVARLKK